MNTSELKTTKEELLSWIKSLEDNAIVSLLNSVKLSSEGVSGDWWDELKKSDKVNILNGIEDYNKGDTMSSKDFWNHLNNG